MDSNAITESRSDLVSLRSLLRDQHDRSRRVSSSITPTRTPSDPESKVIKTVVATIHDEDRAAIILQLTCTYIP